MLILSFDVLLYEKFHKCEPAQQIAIGEVFQSVRFDFSNCMEKPKKFYGTHNETTGKRSVKKNPIIINENKNTMNSPTVNADTFRKKLLTLQLMLKVQPHRSSKNVLKFLIIMIECIKFEFRGFFKILIEFLNVFRHAVGSETV